VADAQRRERALVLDHEMVQTVEFHGMIGRSPAMLDIFSRIRRVAPHFRNLLITGPTGTGKELVARALHQLSRGAAARFVTCNCSAIVETLIESELFGHVAGAFTGATRDKAGLFEYANQGTLFLDEIGDMPLATQAKLLRVLQHQEVQPVGSPAVRKIDVRVIAATHRNLAAMVAAREFREDLYYRLATVEVLIPRLSDRIEDLPLLVRYFIERFAVEYSKPVRGLTRRAQTLLSRYAWPGNVRELENVLGNACIMTDGELIDVADLPERVREPVALAGPSVGETLLSLAELERRHVGTVLAAVGGNKAQAAEVLGVSRATLYRLLSAINDAAQVPARSREKSHLPDLR
jgi:DNA-binding NtrC family response regulator